MTRLTAGKKTRKKPSEFQKLWKKAENLKQQNARFRQRLDGIIRRMQTDIRAAEEAAARQHIPLLKRLITLGQRKSLTQWQRRELDDWIHEILEPLQHSSHLDAALREDIARYEAFRLGIELDEDDPTPVTAQLQAHIEREDAQIREEQQAQKEDWRAAIHDEVERLLDEALGPEPPRPERVSNTPDDLFQDELQQAQQRAYETYRKARETARAELLEEMLEYSAFLDDDKDDDFFDSDFGFGSTDAHDSSSSAADNDTPAISNRVFKQLFRSTAAALHPDREHDPELREVKHKLMTALLKARKQGDVMTIIQMHQEHVSHDSALSKADEQQLIAALKAQVSALKQERESYSFESPLHRMAYEVFYSPSAKKTEQALEQHIRRMETAASQAQSLAQQIKTLKTLKPHLEQRYDESRFNNPLDALDALFGFDP